MNPDVPYKYRTLFTGVIEGVIHIPSQRFIPNNVRNKDWQDFLQWRRTTGLDAEPWLADDAQRQQHFRTHMEMERNMRINAVSWMIERHRQQLAANLQTSLTQDQYCAVLNYIQALRDVPQTNPDLTFIRWPVCPTF